MWRVQYYLSGGTRTDRFFTSLAAATDFMVYKISAWDVYDCYLVRD